MLSKFLFALQRGSVRLRKNTKLLFLVVVLFVFPLLFITVLEQFYDVAAANVQTAELQRIGAIHDAIAISLSSGIDVSLVLTAIANENEDIEKFNVYETISDNVVAVTASMDVSELLATSTVVSGLNASRVNPGETVIVPLRTDRGRILQAVRFEQNGAADFYIFSEHNRANFDTLLLQRKLNAYLLLSLIFAFMIALAYWINQQIDWERRHNKLQASLIERDLFSNMIAHEFRTPLTAIKGYASFLQESQTLTKDEKRFADTIRESTERLVLLVNDFLEIARIQSGKMKIKFTEVDARSLISSVVTSLQGKATEKGLLLVYTPGLKPQMITTDQNRFIQVLTNIISNSVKYTDAGSVEISCEDSRAGLTIRIKDTGMGISADDQKKLFAPFSRVGGVEHTSTTGTGLGMWITKQLVELLGGSIAIESIKGVGTHVVMTFKRTR